MRGGCRMYRRRLGMVRSRRPICLGALPEGLRTAHSAPSSKAERPSLPTSGETLRIRDLLTLRVYGVVFALVAWLGGPTRPARFLRKLAAPELRESPGVAYAAAAALLLALVAWGPTPAFRQLAWILLFAALLALGVTVLRRQTAVEFPGVRRGDAMRELRERRQATRARESATTQTVPVVSPPNQAVDELDRLAALHDSGQLSDTEFAAAKTKLANGN